MLIQLLEAEQWLSLPVAQTLKKKINQYKLFFMSQAFGHSIQAM